MERPHDRFYLMDDHSMPTHSMSFFCDFSLCAMEEGGGQESGGGSFENEAVLNVIRSFKND